MGGVHCDVIFGRMDNEGLRISDGHVGGGFTVALFMGNNLNPVFLPPSHGGGEGGEGGGGVQVQGAAESHGA